MKPLYILLFVITFVSCSKKETKQSLSSENPYYDQAYAFLDKGKNDSAFFYFSKAKDLFIEVNDSINIANCFIVMAIIEKDQGDNFGAQESSLKAMDYLDEKNPKHHLYIGSNYNSLATATYNLKEYQKAIDFYKKALKFSTDTATAVAIKNNLALSYQYLKRYKEAFDIYINLFQQTKNNPSEHARVISNFAKAKWQHDSSYVAVPDYLKSLQIRKQSGDLLGQNASLAHLADYYIKEKPDSALFYALQQYEITKKLHNANDQIRALYRLILLSPPNKSKQYFQRYKYLNDSVQDARAAAKNQFALIRYEVEKNKADNLRLEKENAEKQSRLIRQRVITGASIFLLLLAVGGGTLWYKRRKQRLELEAENKVKETQLHLSKKIHDVVANGIYRVMSEIEHSEDVDRDGVLDKLENMYHQSRDISHNVEQQTITEIPYNEQLASLLKSFAADHRRVLIAGNDAEQWTDVSKRIKEEVKHVLQELMVNMKKHSQAEQVVVRFEKLDQQLTIYYKDNGVGMPAEKSQGKGLANTVSRIESLGGKIIFVSEPGKGLSITTNIPL
ncbi:ATP-binding protein [Sphingobacterium sp. BIGb0165]|uniref:tetratricopeptide repeat-containing sensor histidine kinase n=1 Tax=Sphingobacterium sp. BIGb0165 TaxID=2940615 RepID=UPI002168C6CE|nr:ATP-binding protein [Sphingobacterium sp. BIGb0165]MCS4228885.1 signal transduction histidine kinase [Sphingobacterium sp. BIGb0165]